MIDDILNIFTNAPTTAKIAIIVVISLVVMSNSSGKKKK